MNIIDTNCVTHIIERQLDFTDIYYLVPDVVEEVELYQFPYNQNFFSKVKLISDHPFFDECIYVDSYKKMLNKHEGKSFFNMTGFGDISVLAAVHTILYSMSENLQRELFGLSEISVFTEDKRLAKRITKEFRDRLVNCRMYKDLI